MDIKHRIYKVMNVLSISTLLAPKVHMSSKQHRLFISVPNQEALSAILRHKVGLKIAMS